jgi:hypothetical protein
MAEEKMRDPVLLPSVSGGEPWPVPLIEGDYYLSWDGGYWELKDGTWKKK